MSKHRYVFDGHLTARDIYLIERAEYDHPILIQGCLPRGWDDKHLTLFEWEVDSPLGYKYTRSSHMYTVFVWNGGLSGEVDEHTARFYFFRSKEDKQKVIDLLPEMVIAADPFQTIVHLPRLKVNRDMSGWWQRFKQKIGLQSKSTVVS